MADLQFQINGVEPALGGLTPLLHFKLQVRAASPTATIQALLLNVQIQVQCPQRTYSAPEKAQLVELFGPPELWGQTLRNRLWIQVNATVPAFTGSTEIVLPVPCTYDLNIATAKYFHALDDGEVSLLFLFSGSMFYTTPEDRLQVERISWNSECVYSIPVALWRKVVEQLHPNSAWLVLQRDAFDRLCAYKRQAGFATWEQTIEQLLQGKEEIAAPHSTPMARRQADIMPAEEVAA